MVEKADRHIEGIVHANMIKEETSYNYNASLGVRNFSEKWKNPQKPFTVIYTRAVRSTAASR